MTKSLSSSDSTHSPPVKTQQIDPHSQDTIAPPTSAAAPDENAVEEALAESEGTVETNLKANIENTPVQDDPRLWNPKVKWAIVGVLSWGALIPTMNANIFFPAIADLKRDLNASDQLVSLSVSLYILFQGSFPLFWSPLSEVIGRKKCFLAANILFLVATVVTSVTPNMPLLIVFRVVAAMGSAANLSIAAGSIADMYVPEQRGQVIGIYYSAPVVGPALSPIFGGALTEADDWRATFYFMAAAGGLSLILYALIREPFRTERSLAWQAAKARALAKAEATELKSGGSLEKGTPYQNQEPSNPPLPIQGFKRTASHSSGPFVAPNYHSPGVDTIHHVSSADGPSLTSKAPALGETISRKSSRRVNKVVTSSGEEIKFKPRLSDVNPLSSAAAVLRQPHNLVTALFSSLVFGSQYSLSYTASRTFANPPYNYSPVLVGLVLLALGAGGVVGSILGGRHSDTALRKIASKTGRPAEPEDRIKGLRIWLAMIIVPPAFISYGWTVYYQTNIAGPVVSLFFLGTFQFYLYSPALSYLVDSNKGRSSGAVAVNSCSRGLLAFVASEVAGPLQDGARDGALYTGWAVLLIVAELALVLVSFKGGDWRDGEWRWPSVWELVTFDKEREHGSRWIKRKREDGSESLT